MALLAAINVTQAGRPTHVPCSRRKTLAAQLLGPLSLSGFQRILNPPSFLPSQEAQDDDAAAQSVVAIVSTLAPGSTFVASFCPGFSEALGWMGGSRGFDGGSGRFGDAPAGLQTAAATSFNTSSQVPRTSITSSDPSGTRHNISYESIAQVLQISSGMHQPGKPQQCEEP